jgi:hypothetical protein
MDTIITIIVVAFAVVALFSMVVGPMLKNHEACQPECNKVTLPPAAEAFANVPTCKNAPIRVTIDGEQFTIWPNDCKVPGDAPIGARCCRLQREGNSWELEQYLFRHDFGGKRGEIAPLWSNDSRHYVVTASNECCCCGADMDYDSDDTDLCTDCQSMVVKCCECGQEPAEAGKQGKCGGCYYW